MPAELPAGQLDRLARRLESARLALWIGSPELRERTVRLMGGELHPADAERARRDLDELGRVLLG